MIMLFTKKHLMASLKQAGLPSTYPTILEYERKRIIEHPKISVYYSDRAWRMYTRREINVIVEKVREHRKWIKTRTNIMKRMVKEILGDAT